MKLSKKLKRLDFVNLPDFEGIFYQDIFSFMSKIVGNISSSTKEFRFVPKSQILTLGRMDVFQYFHLTFAMEQNIFYSF